MNISRNSSQRKSHWRPGEESRKIARKAGFEQQDVPLEGPEILTGRADREVKDQQQDQARAAKKSECQNDGERRPRDPGDAQREVARVGPEHGGHVPERARAHGLMHAAQVIPERQHALGADQPIGLHAERDERR
jgi:hypothetical protein